MTVGGYGEMIRRGIGLIAAVGIVGAIAAPAASAETQTVFNTAPITFSGDDRSGGGSTYPSTIQVSGQEGPITDVDLNINAIDMARLGELMLLLVSPTGETEVAKAYHCGGQAADDLYLTFDQQAGGELYFSDTTCVSDSYKPSSECVGLSFCHFWDSIEGAPHSSNFDSFNGENANGTWRLYAWRECYGDSAGCPATGDRIGAGWSLSIDTGPFALDLPAGGGTFGPASPYPNSVTMFGSGLITDVNATMRGVFHTYPDDIEIMVEGPGGQRVMLMSDACGGFDVNAYIWTWDDEAPARMTDDATTNVCGTPSYRPTDHQPGENLPAPAPPGPYGTDLSVFDLTEPSGTWRLWVADDASGDEGFMTNGVSLDIRTRPMAATAFTTSAITVAEGEAVELTVTRSGADSYAAGAVDIATSSGTAGAGDFAPVSRRLEFATGETTKTIAIDVPTDGATEAAETFTVTLSGPTGDARLTSPRDVAVTIAANQPPATEPPPGEPADGGATANDGSGGGETATDTTPPETSIAKAPKRKSATRRARIEFSASEAGSTFECKLDKAEFGPCTSPAKLKKLRRGRHRFEVRAIDAAGNVDPTPAKAGWRVRR